MPTRTCQTPGCTRPREENRRSHCQTCRTRIRRHGTPHITTRTDHDPTEVDTAVIRRAFPEGLTETERRHVGQRLIRLGYSVAAITELSGASIRTVWRWKAAARTA
ncbi:hypothetical protein [Streptomyces sp. NPDC056387]|uniref:hypothetical protein n=1 Tax=Streptomyces sp. NPDC056387 TaxID=3345803 RepID=UPI0035E1D59A